MTQISKEMKAKLRGKETWTATYEGHEIKVINRLKATLYIDGVGPMSILWTKNEKLGFVK